MFSERIKEIRSDYGYTQEEMAQLLFIDRSHLSKLESEKKNPSKLLVKSICREFNVNESWLVDGEGDKYTDNQIATVSKYCDAVETASVYILKYTQIAEMLEPSCDLNDEIFADIITDYDYMNLINFFFSRIIQAKRENSVKKLCEVFESAFPEYSQYRYTDNADNDIYRRHQSLQIWKDADDFRRAIGDVQTDLQRKQAMKLEEKLLSHRIYQLRPREPKDSSS